MCKPIFFSFFWQLLVFAREFTHVELIFIVLSLGNRADRFLTAHLTRLTLRLPENFIKIGPAVTSPYVT